MPATIPYSQTHDSHTGGSYNSSDRGSSSTSGETLEQRRVIAGYKNTPPQPPASTDFRTRNYQVSVGLNKVHTSLGGFI